MARIKVSSKGQIVLPKEVRERHRIRAGGELEVIDRADEIVLRPVARFAPTRIEDVYGCLYRKGQRPRTLKEMDEGVMREAKRVGDRIKRGLG
jgi:AbrB family looped-hinge helix DNA binding protein